MIVLGAGMSGCLFGALNKDSTIYEAQKEIPDNHHAVLRFREDKISKATGIPFKKVKVYKSIWFEGDNVIPSPNMSNLYSRKVSGKILSRSIDNIDPTERFIAPSDFAMILADMCAGRIKLNSPVASIDEHLIRIGIGSPSFSDQIIDRNRTPIISTMPMKTLSAIISIPINQNFEFKSIRTSRYKIDNCDVYQTVYYPQYDFDLYRSTLTGEDLLIESIINGPYEQDRGEKLSIVLNSLGLSGCKADLISDKEQKYGKISPINDFIRKNFMFTATRDLSIYSLGRFACWRNILMDDVYDDIFKIKNMLLQDIYDIKARFV